MLIAEFQYSTQVYQLMQNNPPIAQMSCSIILNEDESKYILESFNDSVNKNDTTDEIQSKFIECMFNELEKEDKVNLLHKLEKQIIKE